MSFSSSMSSSSRGFISSAIHCLLMRSQVTRQGCKAAATNRAHVAFRSNARAALMNAVTGVERGGIGAEAADGGFPHDGGLYIEDQIELDVGDQPRGLRKLFIQLARPPARISGKHARARRRPRLEH